jgi:hypothetical protein
LPTLPPSRSLARNPPARDVGAKCSRARGSIKADAKTKGPSQPTGTQTDSSRPSQFMATKTDSSDREHSGGCKRGQGGQPLSCAQTPLVSCNQTHHQLLCSRVCKTPRQL